MTINKGVGDALADQLIDNLKAEILPEIKKQVEAIDIEKIVKDVVKKDLHRHIEKFEFPNESIPSTAIDFSAGKISGDKVLGGTIKNFSSTGIEDLAKDVQLTLMNQMTVVENQLVAATADIKGDTKIAGKLSVKGGFDRTTVLEVAKEISKDVHKQIKIKLDEDLETFRTEDISGDRIKGGTITDFSSTGIEDKASDVKLTILDNAVVFENKLVAKEVEIKGNTTIDGNLVIKGNMPLDAATKGTIVSEAADTVYSNIASTLKSELKQEILTHYKTKGIDASNLTVNGKQIFDNDNSLSPVIRTSKLTKVGQLEGLIVRGEAEISSTTIGHNRLGINTKQPAAALSVWEEEVEILMGKLREHTSFIGSNRRQDVVLTAGGKENIKLQPDGGTVIKFLIANQTLIASAPEAPNFEGEMGDVLFNTKPKHGGPWGWMCLGGARWAEMGKLT